MSIKNTFHLFLILFISNYIYAVDPTPSFPGAEGFGRYTTGGRGGAVYHVTSLADDGSAGTLRWAINQSGKRTIVFDISGTIRLNSALSIRNGWVTIAGQTAPGDGICVADYPFTINASNVIIRFMRFRLGNLKVAEHEGDGLGGMDQENIIVDHCSASWSIDECLSVYGMRNSTVQWCLVSQSLRNAGHSKGAHGYGGIWGGSGASYHHNLLCHHDSRTPRLGPRPTTQTDERMDMRNNVIYNWGGNGCYGGEGMNVNIVNNYYKPGPGTKKRSTSIQYRIAAVSIRTTAYVTDNPAFAPMLHVWGKLFVEGNYMNGFSDVTTDNWTKGIYEQISNSANDYLFTDITKDTMRLRAPLDYVHTTTHTAAVAYDKVLSYAGASLVRDWHDSLMISDTRNGVASFTGSGNIPGIVNSQNDNRPADAPEDWSAWPLLKSATCPADTDQDGMPDNWEIANGLNPNDASDRNTLNSEGYTMLEVYMNSIVQSIMDGGNADGIVTGGSNGNEEKITEKITLSQTTYIGSSSDNSTWNFINDYAITNANSKGYAAGSENCVKFSRNVLFTINLPLDVTVDSVQFVGYDNYADADSYLSELNGETFEPTEYVFTKKDSNGNYVMCNHTVPLASPASGSISFTFGGNQVAVQIILIMNKTTDLFTTVESKPDPDAFINVYSIDGKLIREQVRRRYASENLPTGIYIIDKQKVAIFN